MPYEEKRRFPTSPVFRGWIALAHASVSTLIGIQNGLVTGSFRAAGWPEQHSEWLPRFASRALLRTFGPTEPLSGCGTVQGLRTVAKHTGDIWTINGAERWIGKSSVSEVSILWACYLDDNQNKRFHRPDHDRGLLGEADRDQAFPAHRAER